MTRAGSQILPWPSGGLLSIVCLLAVLLFPRPVEAGPVSVTSGEHEGFTRIALDFGDVVDWQFGRGLDGYRLRLADRKVAYDLSKVFSRAGKSRLASIWADPETGDLQLSMACSCHAMPFEFRPGIVVIDLKDGPPPGNSSFEEQLADQAGDASTLVTEVKRPRQRPTMSAGSGPKTLPGYDWTKLALAGEDKGHGPAVPTTKPSPSTAVQDQPQVRPSSDPALQSLRDQVLLELADGASRGIIQLAKPDSEPQSTASISTFPSAQIRIDGAPMAALDSGGLPGDLAAKGEDCPEPELLALATWGEAGKPFDQQLADARQGLIGEFDKTEPEVLERTVRLLLFLGFGAEARSYLEGFDQDLAQDGIYRSLSYIVDGEPDPTRFFTPFGECAGPAALWSVLSGAKPGAVNEKAALLAFSDLPVQLRRNLGPGLAQSFLDSDKTEAARAVRDAILRSPEGSSPEVQLLKAEMAARSGDAESAAQELQNLRAQGGAMGNDALVALIELRAASRQAVPAEDAASIGALIAEQEPGPSQDRYRAAFRLALAASGQFDAAFAMADTGAVTEADLWGLLAKLGDDEALLRHAIPALSRPEQLRVEPAEALEIARRVISIGLPKEGKAWADLSGAAGPEDRLVAAIALGDAAEGLKALAEVAQDAGEDAMATRRLALRMAGENDALAEEFLDDPASRSLALARAGDLQELAKSGDQGWKEVAQFLSGQIDGTSADAKAPGGETAGQAVNRDTISLPPALRQVGGGLAQGKSQIEGATMTREAVLALLAKVPLVSANP